MKSFSLQQSKIFLKETFISGLVLSVIVYALVRSTFHDIPFSVAEDGSVLFKTIMSGCAVVSMLKLCWYFILITGKSLRRFTVNCKIWLSERVLHLSAMQRREESFPVEVAF